MNNFFVLLFLISLLCIPIFVIWACVNFLRKRPVKKMFKRAGISAAVFAASIVGVGVTTDTDKLIENSSVQIFEVSSELALDAESTVLESSISDSIEILSTEITETSYELETETTLEPLSDLSNSEPTETSEIEKDVTTETHSEVVTETAPEVITETESDTEPLTDISKVSSAASNFTATPKTESQKAESTPASEAPPQEHSAQSNEIMVWQSATGSKYHSINNCGRMNPDKATPITLDEAISRGLERCSKCW